MQIERQFSNAFSESTRPRKRAIVRSGLALLALGAVAMAVFLPSTVGAAEANPDHAIASCHHSDTTPGATYGTAPCTTPITVCTGAPTTTTTTEVPKPKTIRVPVTTTTAVETTTSVAQRVTTTLPTTTVPTLPTPGVIVPPPNTAATTTTPAGSGPVGGGLIPAATTTLPAPIVAGITVVSPKAAVSASTNLPRTGSDSALPALFGLSCLVAGALLMVRLRRPRSMQPSGS